jgi:predicted nuclease of predicted toxin-antitoxin system
VKFKIDENLPAEIAADLRSAGHDALTVPDQGLTGAADPNLMRVVRTEQRVLLTMDKGVADITTYPPQDYFGIVLFRPESMGRGAVLEFVRRQLPGLLPRITPRSLMVVSEQGIRIR